MPRSILKDIENYLDDYFEFEDPQFAVLITGKWGCGKTYYIKRLIERWKAKERENEIQFKPIYVPLNGINSISAIYSAIRVELHPWLESKGYKIARNVVGGTLKVISRGFIDVDQDGNKDDLSGMIDFDELLNTVIKDEDGIKGKRIFVFDDLERCKLEADQLFGFINMLTEHSDCRIILLADEEKLRDSDKNKDYDIIKEKLIGQTFSFDNDITEIASSIIKFSKFKSITENANLVLDLFNACGYNNLRTLKRSIITFKRLCSLFPGNVKESKSYPEFVKNVLSYYLICCFEIASGDIDFDKHQGYDRYLNGLSDGNNKPLDKYKSVLTKNSISVPYYSIPIESLCLFIKSGHIDNLSQIISSSYFFSTNNPQSWELLWNYSRLSEEEYLENIRIVKENLSSNRIYDVSTVLHCAGVLIASRGQKLTTIPFHEIVRDAKSCIDSIMERYSDPSDPHIRVDYQSAFGKEYAAYKSEYFKKIALYHANLLSKKRKDYFTNIYKETWEGLSNNTTDHLSHLINEKYSYLGSSTELLELGICYNVKASIVAESISKLDNKHIIDICQIIETWFSPYSSSGGPNKAEIEFLCKLSKELSRVAYKKPNIAKHNLRLLSTIIDKGVKKTNY